MAHGGAQSLARLVGILLVIAFIAGGAAGLWLLRPVPSYSSDDVTAGSPFDVTFRVENKDAWFPLANLKISCVLAHVRAAPIAPTLIAATNVRFAATGARGLEPGESGTFTCPFLSFLEHQVKDDPSVATRAEIYFRSTYDVPLLEWFRLTDNSGRFFLDTRVLPPRWVGKPQ
jgi:hypothetical protein